MDGGPGNDTITTRGGVDALLGGAGNDTLDGAGGADILDGGADKDTVTYATRTAAQPVVVDIDGVADDGGSVDGSADNVMANVENVTGGAGDDQITGYRRREHAHRRSWCRPGSSGLGSSDTIRANDGVIEHDHLRWREPTTTCSPMWTTCSAPIIARSSTPSPTR